MSHQLYRFCSNPNKAEGSQVQVPLDSAFPTKVGDYFRFFGPMNFSRKLFFSPFPAHAIHDGYIMLNPFEILELWSGELDLLFHPGRGKETIGSPFWENPNRKSIMQSCSQMLIGQQCFLIYRRQPRICGIHVDKCQQDMCFFL